MIPKDIRPLLDSLREKSRGGRLGWEASASPLIEQDFFVALGEYTLNIFRVGDEAAVNPHIAFRILDAGGKSLYSFGVYDGDPDFREAEELLTFAARKANRVDEVVDHLTRALAAV